MQTLIRNLLINSLLVLSATAHAQNLPLIATIVDGSDPMVGFFNLYWDASSGRLYWEIDKLDTEFLYQVSMASGLGSNPVGIDRGQLRGTFILRPKRVGPKVFLMQSNYRYRASTENAQEQRAVEDSFAPSILWAFEVVAETEDRVLVDSTDFFKRDARDVVNQIASRNQGNYSLDELRSTLHLENTDSFEENVEVEAILTFQSDNPGTLVNNVAATGKFITLRQHHSIVKLPDSNFKPRLADPRIGTNGPTIQDYSTAINEDLFIRLVARHRLEKKDPYAARSEPVEPIIYYVDSGTPEPIKSALIEGASWWNEAFEAAGFINAFRVMELPEGADAQDIRYNMIHWTHRRTRGYSYGGSVIDPRTGEIIKGNVNLGSLRLRQNYLHGQGLVPAFEYLSQTSDRDKSSIEMSLQRVRQLSAHEVGHTLGYPHNYLASSYGRESVMDYPAPLVGITEDEKLDLSDAYLQRIGEYDKLAVRYSYEQFLPGSDESEELGQIIQESLDRGLIFIAHNNNNFIGAGHQFASVWDNGENLVDQLEHEIAVRRIGLKNFSLNVIQEGKPHSALESVLLPLYMHHRFQLNAASQSIGGADYRYSVRGDGQIPFKIVDGAEQRDALKTVLSTLSVDFLKVPVDVLELIPPPAFRHTQGETFESRTGLFFDSFGAAESAASFSVNQILHPSRMARLLAYGTMGDYPDLQEVIDSLLQATWGAPVPEDEYGMQLLSIIQRVTADEMIRKASDQAVSSEVKSILSERLNSLASRLEEKIDPNEQEINTSLEIRRWQRREASAPPMPLGLPPGDPI